MCLVVLTTSHPRHALILLSNRDELVGRPTAPADWWQPDGDPDNDILSGRDLKHPSHGTWLGISRQGRIAVLTNFREKPSEEHGDNASQIVRSRGEIPRAYLVNKEPPAPWAEKFLDELHSTKTWGVLDGFSLIFGQLSRSKLEIGVVSNRTAKADQVVWLVGDQSATTIGSAQGLTTGFACALSNSNYGDRAWPKVVDAERLVEDLIQNSPEASVDDMVEQCFGILRTNSMPRRGPREPLAKYGEQFRQSIFIPLVENDAGILYGTTKQTVIIVSHNGHVHFLERTIADEHGPVPQQQAERRVEFDIKGWSQA